MSEAQPGILAPVPSFARYMTFSQAPGSDPRPVLEALADVVDGETIVLGVGLSLARHLGASIDGLRAHPELTGAGFDVPSTPAALWCWIRGADRGDVMHTGRRVQRLLVDAFEIDEVIDAFKYHDGFDLTGYEDGTENPEGDDAIAAALVTGAGPGADGASFVAVQQWVHDFEVFEAKPVAERDNIIGRRQSDNEELADAPPSAHVKRTAQESFEPEAFILRRSMPWTDEYAAGLQFVAFGRSLDAFEAQLRRMVGAEDGIADALFTFTRPLTGAYFWCPPMKDGRPDLGRLGM